MVLNDNLVVGGSGTLAFGVAGSITDNGNGYGLTLNGAGGTLILGGNDSYNGGTRVIAGTLILTSNTALPDGTSLTVGAGGSLVFDSSQAALAVVTALPSVAAVPEPGTLLLLTAGTVAAFTAWRRRKAAGPYCRKGL